MTEELTPRQRKVLRSTARKRDANIIIGKRSISESVVKHIDTELDRHELVKVRLPRTIKDRKETARQLARATGASLIDLIGYVVVLYRPNEKLPVEKRVRLDEK